MGRGDMPRTVTVFLPLWISIGMGMVGESSVGEASIWIVWFERMLVLFPQGEKRSTEMLKRASLADEAGGGARQRRVRHARLSEVKTAPESSISTEQYARSENQNRKSEPSRPSTGGTYHV